MTFLDFKDGMPEGETHTAYELVSATVSGASPALCFLTGLWGKERLAHLYRFRQT